MSTKSLVGTAFFIALGVILPQIFHALGAGSVFLPMHIPVLLCGFCFGPWAGFICGVITPFISSVITGMPPIFPVCVTMIFELSTYGLVSGLLYKVYRKNIYLSLIGAMLAGRIVGALAAAVIYGLAGNTDIVQVILNSYFLTGLPGILIQLVVIPIIVVALRRSKLITLD